jgi:hypothetical protein
MFVEVNPETTLAEKGGVRIILEAFKPDLSCYCPAPITSERMAHTASTSASSVISTRCAEMRIIHRELFGGLLPCLSSCRHNTSIPAGGVRHPGSQA